MKKIYFFMTMVLLSFLTVGVTACGDDENVSAPDLPTPAFETISGKYNVTSAGSPYESIELGASGNYVVVLNGGGYAASAAVMRSGHPVEGASLFADRKPQSRAQTGNWVYGTFKDLGEGRYELEDFGTIELVYGDGGRVTGIEVDSDRYGSASLTVEKGPEVADDALTDALCRTWTVESIREVMTNLATGEKSDETIAPAENPDAPKEMFMSKSGTYLIFYTDGSIDLGYWKWRDQKDGTIYYAWEGDDWYEENFATFTFSGEKLTTYEIYEEDGYRDEIYATMVAKEPMDDGSSQGGNQGGNEQPSGDSPVANVFTGKLLKTLDGETFIYEDGFLTEIVDEDNPNEPLVRFEYHLTGDDPYVDLILSGESGGMLEATLNKQGFVESVIDLRYDDVTKFTYDSDGHVVAITDGRNEREDVLTWENGDLVHVSWKYIGQAENEFSEDFGYYAEENVNGLMWYYNIYDIDIDEIQYFYWAGLLGKAPKHLPKSQGDDYSYEWSEGTLKIFNNKTGTVYEEFSFSFYE